MTTNARRVNLVDRDLRLAVSAPVGSFSGGRADALSDNAARSAGSLVPSVWALDVWAEKTRSAFAPFKACTIAPGSSSCVATIRLICLMPRRFRFSLTALCLPGRCRWTCATVAQRSDDDCVQPDPYRTFTPIIVGTASGVDSWQRAESVRLTTTPGADHLCQRSGTSMRAHHRRRRCPLASGA